MHEWKPFLKKINLKTSPVFLLFNTNDFFDINILMENYELDLPYFLDPEQSFKKNNHFTLKNDILNTVLTRNDTVILAGNPLINPKLKELFLNEIRK